MENLIRYDYFLSRFLLFCFVLRRSFFLLFLCHTNNFFGCCCWIVILFIIIITVHDNEKWNGHFADYFFFLLFVFITHFQWKLFTVDLETWDAKINKFFWISLEIMNVHTNICIHSNRPIRMDVEKLLKMTHCLAGSFCRHRAWL